MYLLFHCLVCLHVLGSTAVLCQSHTYLKLCVGISQWNCPFSLRECKEESIVKVQRCHYCWFFCLIWKQVLDMHQIFQWRFHLGNVSERHKQLSFCLPKPNHLYTHGSTDLDTNQVSDKTPQNGSLSLNGVPYVLIFTSWKFDSICRASNFCYLERSQFALDEKKIYYCPLTLVLGLQPMLKVA